MVSHMDELRPSESEASGSTHTQTEQSETMEPQSGVASTSRKRRGRGPSRGIATAKALRASGKKKLPILLEVHRGVPVDMYSEKFVSELGSLVKKHATLAVRVWAEVPEESKNLIYDRIRDTFEFVDSPEVKKMVFRHANKLYRERRTHLHTDYYQKYETDEERLRNIPRGVSAREWMYLLNYFSSENFKRMSNRNKVNRGKKKGGHVTGRKSFQAIRYDNRCHATGEEPNKLQLWRLTHKNKRGEWCDQYAHAIDEAFSQKIIESQEADGSIALTEDDAFQLVVGETSGYVRGMGFGPLPQRSGQRMREELKREMEQIRTERDEARIEWEEAKKEHDQLAQKMARVEVRLEEMHTAMILQTFQQMRPGEVTFSCMETQQEQGENITTQSQRGRNQGNHRNRHEQRDQQNGQPHQTAQWTPELHKAFVELCYNQVLLDNRPGTHLSRQAWRTVVNAFHRVTGKMYEKSQLKKHWDTTKDLWKLWHKLISNAGVRWDRTTNTVVASNEFWEDYLERNPEAEQFRHGGLQFAFELDVMYGGTMTTTDGAWAPNPGVLREFSTGPRQTPPTNEPDNREFVLENQQQQSLGDPEGGNIGDAETSTRRRRRESLRLSSLSRSKRLSGATHFAGQLDQLCDAVELRSTTPQVARDDEGTTINDCITLLNDIEEITRGSELYMFAVDLFLKKEYREAFVALGSSYMRLIWVQRQHDLVTIGL